MTCCVSDLSGSHSTSSKAPARATHVSSPASVLAKIRAANTNVEFDVSNSSYDEMMEFGLNCALY
jgi:hypothetical protein